MDIVNLHIHKLSHELEEIRIRSLNNICNKLEMGLIREDELIENPDFIRNIISWFSYPRVPKKDIVLQLILRISKIDRGKALIVRYDPHLKILQEATKGDDQDLFEEILLNCRSFVGPTSPYEELSSSLDVPLASRKPKVGSVWLLWRWLPQVELTESDSRLISSLHASLLSLDQFYHSAHFFSSILIRDFPPQLFLQKPQIINVFLDVIQSRKPEAVLAVDCLEEFTCILINQINLCRNVHTTPLFSNHVKGGSMELSVSTVESSISSYRSIESCSQGICKKDRIDEQEEKMDLMDYCVLVLETTVKSEIYTKAGLIRAVLKLLRIITADPNIPWLQAPVHRCSNVFAMLAAASHRSHVLEALDKLELNIVMWELFDKLIPVDVADIAVNKQMQDSLYQCVLDPVLSLIFPKIHSSFSDYIEKCKYSPSATHKLLSQVGSSIKAGAQFLLSFEKLPVKESVNLFMVALKGIEYHQNYSIILQFLQLCVRRSSEITVGVDESITSAVLQLLSNSDPCIVKSTLGELYELAKRFLGPGESTKTVVSVQPILPILINHKILIDVISYCLHSQNKELVVLSEDILILIIKSRRLLNEKYWNLILSELVVTFPFLQVFGNKSSALGKEILNLFDPDTASAYQLAPLQVLMGNIRFLVSKDAGTREEAVSRLMYLLDISSKPLNLILPHDPIVPKKNLNDIYEASSMIRVIDLLCEPGLDSRVVKSALIQLSVMTEDILLHDLFVQHSGMEIIQKYLTSNDKELYKEMFAPAITIVKNFVRTNGKIRHEYSLKQDILKNAVRGLFLYDLDWRMQRDISQFLVLVAFSNVVHTSVDNVSFPRVILDRIRDPFPPVAHAECSQYALPSYKDELLSDGSRQCLLSLNWALGCFGDNIEELLKNSQISGGVSTLLSSSNQSSPSNILNIYPALLPVPKSALLDLATCHPYSNIASALDKFATATSHKRAFDALQSLKRYISFVRMAESVDMSALPWEEAFTRYLATPPSSTTDQQLLLESIKFFNLQSCNFSDHALWLTKLFQEPSPVLIYLLKQTAFDECTSLKKELCMEALDMLKKCIKLVKEGWLSVYTILIDSLNERHSLGFYCLGVTERLIGCIVEANKIGFRSPKDVSALYHLLPAFQPTSPTSYMGLSITTQALISLNLCLSQRKYQEWDKEWDLSCIVDRLACNDVVIRAATLQLLSGLCYSSTFSVQVTACSKDLWSSCLSYVLDHHEANIVREQAAVLCANILYHQGSKSFVEEAENRGLYRALAIVCAKLSNESTLSDKAIGLIQCSEQCLTSISSASSNEDEPLSFDINDNKLMMTTPNLFEAACRLVINLSCISEDVIEPLRTQGLSSLLFRFLSRWCSNDVIIDEVKVSLYSKVCKILNLCSNHAGKLVNDSLCNIVWILQPSSVDIQNVVETTVESLWTEAIKLLGSLLSIYPEARVHITNECLNTILNSASSHNLELQSASLRCIPAIAPSLNSKGSEILVTKMIPLWNKTNIKESTKREICLALASLLGNSHAGTIAALKQGFAESLVLKLRETYVTLSVLPPDIPRHKKCNAVLGGLSVDIALLSNLLAGNKEAKALSSSLGVADALHKLWNWCLLDFSLVSSLLQALVTFSASSTEGALSLVLTSTVVGVGQRKSPTSSSLLHAALQLLNMPVYPVEIKKRVLQLASHACQSQECRVIISKSQVLKDFLKFLGEKKSNSTSELELGWLDFFCVFTSCPEGSNVLKDQEFSDYLVNCLNGSRRDILKLSLNICRNLAFHSQSRQKLLMSDNLLYSISAKLLDDALSLEEEKQDIVLFAWALCANSQKSKQILRNFGFLDRIQLLSALIPEYTKLSTIVDTTIFVLKS